MGLWLLENFETFILPNISCIILDIFKDIIRLLHQ